MFAQVRPPPVLDRRVFVGGGVARARRRSFRSPFGQLELDAAVALVGDPSVVPRLDRLRFAETAAATSVLGQTPFPTRYCTTAIARAPTNPSSAEQPAVIGLTSGMAVDAKTQARSAGIFFSKPRATLRHVVGLCARPPGVGSAPPVSTNLGLQHETGLRPHAHIRTVAEDLAGACQRNPKAVA